MLRRTYIFQSQNTCTFHMWYQIQQIFNYSTTHSLIFNYTCFITQQQEQILYYSATHALLFNNNKYFIFSSPGHGPCELLSWLSKRPSSVNFSHLNLLLWSLCTDLNQACQKCSLGGPLPDLSFWCWFEIQHGCQGP